MAVLCECKGGNEEGDMPRMGLGVPFAYHLAVFAAVRLSQGMVINLVCLS